MNYDLPDHPVIQNMERTGYPDGKEPIFPICPVVKSARKFSETKI